MWLITAANLLRFDRQPFRSTSIRYLAVLGPTISTFIREGKLLTQYRPCNYQKAHSRILLRPHARVDLARAVVIVMPLRHGGANKGTRSKMAS